MPETETPADTIRRAAALMRQSATAATPGRRHTLNVLEVDPNGPPTCRIVAINPTGRGTEEWTPLADTRTRADADHIAPFSPAAAHATADQWDATAARHRESEHYLDKGCCAYCNVGEWPCPDMADTLKAARTYLNETGV